MPDDERGRIGQLDRKQSLFGDTVESSLLDVATSNKTLTGKIMEKNGESQVP